jgi:hypothetical protein
MAMQKYLKHQLQSRVTIIWVLVVCVIEGQCFARGRDSLRGQRMAMQKYLKHQLQSRVTYHVLKMSMYSRSNALPEEGTASEDGGWQCKYLKHQLQSRVTYHHGFQGQFSARGGDSLRGWRIAMQNI